MPKGKRENLEWRKLLLRLSNESEQNRRDLWAMCSRDLLFYVNSFCFTYNPKRPKCPVLPFNTWAYQDADLLAIDQAITDGEDLLIEKSRDLGATWMVLLVLQWRWQFHDWQSFLLVSRKEDLVDKREDPDCLFWKVDFLLKNQPGWLQPSFVRNERILTNKDSGSTIGGESTNGDLARGGRKTAIMLDEFATVEKGAEVDKATADAANSRLFVSTHKGVGTHFYRMSRSGATRKIVMHWSKHPEKNRGLYKPTTRGPVIIDKAFWAPYDRGGNDYTDPSNPNAHYVFSSEIPRGPFGVRSPWYDHECVRRASPTHVAQEIDIDPQGAGHQFFDPPLLDKVRIEHTRPPVKRGRLEFDWDTCEPFGFVEVADGPLLLWCNLDIHSRPSHSTHYGIGCDIATGSRDSAGLGASNSVASIGDKTSKRKIAEYAVAGMQPPDFARHVVALCKWFNEAHLIWESNGPGLTFGNTVVELGYRHMYYRRDEKKITPGKTFSDIPGWHADPASKLTLLTEYRRALQSGQFINPSVISVDECLDYVFAINGSVMNDRSRNDDDPTGARDNHGDRVIADALDWKSIRGPLFEFPHQEAQIADIDPPPGTFAFRRKVYRDRLKAEAAW